MKLVIVESPTKARTIGKFLGDGYTIRASMGHVMDLPKSTLGVDVENNFAPQFEISADKKKTIAELKKLAKEASSILLATDPDREGEAIAANIAELIADGKLPIAKTKKRDHMLSAISHKPIQRIVFHEITKEAIEEALKNPGSVNEDLVAAQIGRRVLDRLVGYKLSPLLWQKVRRGLSAGRVQSVALRLIVEREREIGKFGKENYWTISVALSRVGSSHPSLLKHDAQGSKGKDTSLVSSSLNESRLPKEERMDKEGEKSTFNSVSEGQPAASSNSPTVSFDLIEIGGKKIELQEKLTLYDGTYTVTKTVIDSEEKAKDIEKDLQSKTYTVEEVIQKETKRSPQPPFTTSTLQQQAAIRYGYSGKRTMSLAQKLYEEGYITYHRTDSLTVATSAIFAMRKYIEEVFGATYIPEKPRFYVRQQKNAQEAHEAIRPTKAQVTAEKVAADLGNDYAKLYELIWRRALASQMSDARIESTTVYVAADDSDKTQIKLSKPEIQSIRSSDTSDNLARRVLSESHPKYRFKTNGSVLLFEGFLKINPFGLEDKKLPIFKALERLAMRKVLAESHETMPPARYNDASLIKSLEEAGIGRPSTYATIISTIEARQYIEREEKKFLPTSVGIAVNDFLVKNFSDIDDIPFTADMEQKLDNVAAGEENWQEVLREFYGPFEKKLEVVKKADRVEIPTEETGELCPKDNAPLVIRVGRFGKFISCKNFPACDFKKPFVEETQFSCPKDGGKVIARKTRKGRTFYGCSNYPKCDYAAWKLQDVKRDLEQGIQVKPVKKSTSAKKKKAKQ